MPSVKLWVIEQISLLLLDNQPKIEDSLKKDLASRKQESECVEVLCVFFIAKSKGYVCPNDLGSYINARSTLSDLILSELISNPKDFGSYAYPFTPFVHLNGDNHRFEYYQGSHVPLLYNSWLKKEEQRTGIPFTDHYQTEWNNTFEYQPSSATTIDYFFSGDRQRTTGQFYTQASHRGRSAYLRTIEVAKQFYGMPASYAAHLSILALPIEPAYIGLSPQKPAWLPEWEDEIPPDTCNLTQFVKETLASFAKAEETVDLLALSLPIMLDNNRWIDLTVVKAITDSDPATDIQMEDRSGCLSVGSLLDEKLSYELSKKEQPDDTVLAITPYPFNRYGHWHSDVESRGLYVPKCNIDGKKVTGSTTDGLFCYTVDDIKIGFSSFWYNQWQSIHPKGIRSLCGSYTVVNKEKIGEWLNLSSTQKKIFYVCKAKLLTSEDNFRDFNEQELEFVIS